MGIAELRTFAEKPAASNELPDKAWLRRGVYPSHLAQSKQSVCAAVAQGLGVAWLQEGPPLQRLTGPPEVQLVHRIARLHPAWLLKAVLSGHRWGFAARPLVSRGLLLVAGQCEHPHQQWNRGETPWGT